MAFLRGWDLSKTLTGYNAVDGIMPGEMSPSWKGGDEGCPAISRESSPHLTLKLKEKESQEHQSQVPSMSPPHLPPPSQDPCEDSFTTSSMTLGEQSGSDSHPLLHVKPS